MSFKVTIDNIYSDGERLRHTFDTESKGMYEAISDARAHCRISRMNNGLDYQTPPVRERITLKSFRGFG